MAERNPAPIRIDFVGVETKFLSHRASLRRKRLVAFDDVNVIQIKSRTLEGNRNSLDRPYTHDARFNPGMAPSYDAAHGLEPFLVNGFLRSENDSRRAVIDARRVACGDRSFLVEGGTELCHFIQAGIGADMLVRIENRRALPGLHFDRKNLRGETPLRLRSRGALMAFDRESILCLTADAVFTRYIFRRDAHVTPFKRVTQHRQHSVDRNDIPHFRAPAGTGQHMRRAAHAFRTTRNGNVTFAQCDHLRRRYDGLHARSAQAIERQSRRFNRKAGIYGSDSSEVGILGIALNDLTHDDMAHIRRSDARALYCFLDNKLTQSCRREILEPTTKVTNGSADTGEDVNGFCSHCLPISLFDSFEPGPESNYGNSICRPWIPAHRNDQGITMECCRAFSKDFPTPCCAASAIPERCAAEWSAAESPRQ